MSKDLPGMSTMSLKMDMLHFQDEILHDMRQIQTKLENKYSKIDEALNEKITKFDLKLKNLDKKISELSNLITQDNALKEKIESLFQFKEEMQDTIFKRRAKFAELEKKVNSDIDEINKILSNTVIYPAVIGKTAKFQSFHEFIDYLIQEINILNTFRQKTNLDSFSTFKKKIDGTIDTFKLLINNLTPKELTEQMVTDLEKKFNSTLKIYDDRLQDTRVENSHYSMGIEKKAEEMDKQIGILKNAHISINKKIEKIQNLENFNLLNNEISTTNQRVNTIFEILRDLVAFHPDVKKSYPNEFDKKPNKKIISGVRQYIKGNLNANELSSMKKFAFEKSQTKIFDKTYPVPKATQSTFSENLYNNNYPIQKRQSIFIDSRPIKNDEESFNPVNRKFMSKKTVNYSKQENNIASNKIIESEKFVRHALNRKKTFSFGKTAYNNESSKLNDLMRTPSKNNDFLNRPQQAQNAHNIIEEENEVNNISNNSNNDINENKNKRELEKDKNDKKIESIKSEKNDKKKDNNDSISFLKDDDEDKNKKTDEIDNKDDDDKKSNNGESNLQVKETSNNNNNSINNNNKKFTRKNNENKKVTLRLDLNKKYYQSPERKVESKEKEKEIKQNIFTETENKNSHARNSKISPLENDTNKKDFFNSSKPMLKTPNVINQNNNTNKSQITINSNSAEKNKNQTLEDNKILIPIKYNFQLKDPDISIVSIKKKMYKTFNNNFPKIHQDMSDNKFKLNNNISIPTSKENFTRTINEDNFFKRGSNIISTNIHQKKILLMNPDELPINFFDKAYKDIIKNNPSFSGYQSERMNKIKNKDVNSFKQKGNSYSVNDI